jgi:hypothetical protein
MPVSAKFKVPAAQRLRGWATGWGAVFLVALLVIDSHAGDGYC